MLDPALTIDDLRAAVARLQDLADARLYRARAARITLKSVGIPRSEPVDVGAARAAGMIEDLRAEVARLAAALAAAPEAARRWAAIREAVAAVHAATGLAGDAPLTDDAVAELLAGALQNAARVHYAETALRTDAEAHSKATARLLGLVDGQRERAERAEAALAAAQPVVEWQDHPQVGLLGEDRSWSVVELGHFRLWVDVDGWHLLCSLPGLPANRSIASGPETGDAGKAACEAAYRRAVGLPPK